ncbi:hypothetical protein ABW19_dt0206797 [Dactylella cylindrospora]|nr:hypothetical protein ABW19_dt0206797 [Dactylella cylindrospora]
MDTENQTSILGAPVEVLSRIFEFCDLFSQAIALASTCKALYSVWVENEAYILHKLAGNTIVAYDDALVAVRATEIAIDQSQSLADGKVTFISPSEDPLRRLDDFLPRNRKASTEEIQQVLGFKQLVDCTFHAISNGHRAGINPRRYWTLPEELIGLRLLRNGGEVHESTKFNIYSSFYLSFLAGAVLSKHYMGLFFGNDEISKSFAKELSCTGIYGGPFSLSSLSGSSWGSGDIEHLRRFPLWNWPGLAAKSSVSEHIFEPLIDYILGPPSSPLELGREDAGRWRNGNNSEKAIDEKGVQKIMMLMAVSDMLTAHSPFVNSNDTHQLGRKTFTYATRRQNLSYDYSTSWHRQVRITMYGIFQPEIIDLPSQTANDRLLMVASKLPIGFSFDMTLGRFSSYIDTVKLANLVRRKFAPHFMSGPLGPKGPKLDHFLFTTALRVRYGMEIYPWFWSEDETYSGVLKEMLLDGQIFIPLENLLHWFLPQ